MKTFKSMKILVLTLACVILVAQCHIFPKDISMSPNNLNTPSEFTIIFTLDSPLGPSDYLRIIFPFAITSILSGTWDTYENCSIIGSGNQAVITASAIGSDVANAFFVQFYTDQTTTATASLAANTSYYLQFTATPSTATTGINLPVQISTVSNNANTATWITYDSNPVFGVLSLTAAYPVTMTVTSSIPSTETGYTAFGADYLVNIDLIPKTTITNRARIDIKLVNTNFELLDCESVQSTSENIALLAATFEPLGSNAIRATIASTLFAGNNAKYRFQCSVQNPITAATTQITVETRPGYQETVIDSGTDAVGLSAVAPTYVSPGWDESQHKVLLGWGYEASSPTALNIIGLYSDASATEKWYQSATTNFQPAADLTVIDKIQVVISTVNDAMFTVLQASIYHNLPDYSSTDKVTCSIITQGFLTCQNVGQLQGITYFVSFRFNYGYPATATTAPDFGKVQVQNQATSATLISLSSTALTNTAINSNVPLFVTSGGVTNGVIAFSTTKTSSPSTTTYVTNGEAVQLQFQFNYFKSSFMPLTNTDVGIELYTSNALQSSSQPSCTIKNFLSTDATFTDCGVDQMTSYTRLRFRLALISNQASSGVPYTTFTTNQYGTLVFDPVTFTADQFSSFNYVSENVYDYYARWVQGFAAVNPSITLLANSLPFFFNSVVYTSGALSNLNVGVAFYYSGSTVNDGTAFPTVIRVTGYLTPEEQITADRLLLFFNDFEPQDLTNPCFGPTGITCNYIASTSTLENTQSTNPRTDFTGSRRIEINTDLTQKFNIYIPVSVPNIANFGFFIATASVVGDRATELGIFETQDSKRISATASFTSYNVEAAGGGTPKIDLSASPTMGSAVDTTITNIAAGYVPTANALTNVGAHYGYCANYDFTVASGFTFAPYYSSTASADQYCASLKYTTATTPAQDMYCQICPVHNTMSTGVNVALTQFTLPTLSGVDFYKLTYILSQNTGALLKASSDQQAGLMTALTPSAHSITFSPTDFKKGSKNVYATFSFTVVSILPKTVRINIVPTGSSSDLDITPVTSVGCTVGTIDITSCTISGSSTNIQLDVVAQDDTWPMMTHTIVFMVDASSAASGISIDEAVNYKFTIDVVGISGYVAHHTSASQTYTVLAAASLAMGLTNFNYVLGTQNARTVATFDFEIPSDILVHSNQQIVINLGGIPSANSGVTPLCRILDYETKLAANDFSSCDISSLSAVKLKPNGDITGNYTAEFSFIKVPSSTTGITIQILGVDGSTVIAQSTTALTLPTAPASTSLSTVTFDRLYSNPGNVGEITITLTSANDITNTTYLYVYFPTYYADRLGYQNLACTSDGLPLSCFLQAYRLVQLTDFPADVTAGTSTEIKIYGVITPVVPGTPGKIFIALALSESLLTLSEQTEVNDKASVSTLPAKFDIKTLSLTSNVIRGTADYNISFTTDSTGVRSGTVMAIDLPDSQGSIVRNQTASTVLIYKTGDSLATTVQTTLFGSRFKFNVPVDFNPKTNYSIILKSVKTPQQVMCNIDMPTIIVTDTTENAAIRRSAGNIWDTAPIDFVESSSLKTLGWTDSSGNGITSLSLTIGVYSPEIRIVPPVGENFNTDITFTYTQNVLTLMPTTFKATRGSPYLSMRIAAASTLLPSVLLFDLVKSEGLGVTNRYSNIFRLPVVLTTNIVTLPAMTISIVQGATSFLYGWQLDTLNMIPHTELKVDVAITTPSSTVLSTLGPTSITYSPSAPREGFVFDMTIAASALTPPTFTLSLSGIDSAYYALETATVTVDVLTPPAAAPIISTVTTTANYAPTRQQFTITTDQPTAIYWHVALQGSLSTTDCLRIRSIFDAGQFSDQTNNNQPQYGVFYIPLAATATSNEIGNLMSNQGYSYILCPFNQLDDLGTASTGTFQTADNGATMYEVNLLFSSAISRSQLKAVICVFSQALELPNDNVVAMDGTTCGAASVFDDFSSFDYTNITLYIYGDRRTDATAITKTELTQYITSVSASTPSDFQTSFNSTFQAQSLTSIYQAMTLKSGSTYSDPVISTTATVTTSSTDTTITVSGLQLSSGAGVFYGVTSVDILNVPSYPQIKNKLNNKGAYTSGANALYASGTVQLKFTNLKPVTDYIIYYYASNNDRTQYAGLTEIKYVKASTVASVTANYAPQIQTSMLCLGMMIISAIMFLL